jgi:TonB family protein
VLRALVLSTATPIFTLSCATSSPRGTTAEQLTDIRIAVLPAVNSNASQPCKSPAPNGLCPPLVAADRSWDGCPFPRKADFARIDEAKVLVQVDVAADGMPEGVTILRDPGNDFGQAAAVCALLHSYIPARYEDGRTAPGSFKMQIHFSRPPP